MSETQLDIIKDDERRVVTTPASPLLLLERVLQSPDLTQEKVSVAKELMQMVREQGAAEAKAAFAKAFFQLRKNMPEIYADREAKTESGAVMYRFCSEREISEKLEPHLMAHGFAMLFGQSESEGRITAEVTLMHEAGHEEVRRYTVRAGSTNRVKDATAADAGAATTAWRHLMIKLFGLKSRITETRDIRNEGDIINPEQAQYLNEQLTEHRFAPGPILELAGVDAIEKIPANLYPVVARAIEMKKRAPRRP